MAAATKLRCAGAPRLAPASTPAQLSFFPSLRRALMSPPASPSGCLCRVPHSRSIVVAAVSASASVLSCLHDRSSLKESRIMLFSDVRLLALEHASAVRRPFAAGAPRLRSSLASPGATLVPRAAADVSVGTSYSTEPAYAEAPVGVGEARPCLPTNQAVPGAHYQSTSPKKCTSALCARAAKRMPPFLLN